jgi:hypothetical protein
MKREITFTFRKSIVPAQAEIGYYYFTLTSRIHYGSEYISRSVCPDEFLEFYVARNLDGIWNITGEKSALPDWLFDFQTSFGNAIDESLGIRELNINMRTH